jgi:hypothetical protein
VDIFPSREGFTMRPLHEPSRHSFNTGNVVLLSKRFPARKAAPGPYKVVAQLPERDGQFQYRIKSGCEPFYRTVNENELEVDGGGPLTSASSNELEDRRASMRGAST